jgi:plastocyanin
MSHLSRRPLTTRLVVVAVTLLLAMAVGGILIGTAGAATSTTPVSKITIKGFKFIPNKFAVTTGKAVTVKNKDGATHDLAAVNGAFKTKYIEGGKSAKFTVKKPGTYKIFCTLHPYMTGVLKAS